MPPSVPGKIGVPLCLAMRLQFTLSPSRFMASGLGPMNVNPESRTTSAKWLFSLRKP